MRAPLAILAAALLVMSGGPAPAAAAAAPAGGEEKRSSERASRKNIDYDAPVERWREGPVRYLLSKAEDDAYRALSTEAERLSFIQKFWASRDPVPTTPDNEYRIQFYARVAQANRLFTDSTKPGWKTDRGKIFTLLGPPDDLEQEQYRDGLVADLITWTYRNPPGGLSIDSLPVVRFVRDATGEYRMSNDVLVRGFETTSGITFQLQAMQMKSMPEQKRVLDTIVGARGLFDAGPFRTHRDFYRAGDATMAILTLGVKTDLLAATSGARERVAPRAPAGGAQERSGARGDRYEVLARLVSESPDLPSYDFTGSSGLRGGDDGPLLDSAGYLLFQGGLPVKPGRYTAYYGVIDHDNDDVYSFRETIEIPDLRGQRFRMSRITLASGLEWIQKSPNAYATPFVLGSLRVFPRPDDLFKNGDEFAFYYQIYGPATDPIDGRPDLDVAYQFFVARDDGAGGLRFVPLGKSIRQTRQRSQVQGYSFPLKDWPPATYRLRVEVRDNLSEEHSTEEVSFRVL